MPKLVDVSHFPLCADALEYDDPEHAAQIEDLKRRAAAHVMSWPSAQPIGELVLAMALPPIFALFLVRFERPIPRGELAGETEMWAVAGDLPDICFETIDAPTPEAALRLYCAIAQDWGQAALGRRDISQCYPIPLEPTRRLGRSLIGRTKFLRKNFVPMARRGLAKAEREARRRRHFA